MCNNYSINDNRKRTFLLVRINFISYINLGYYYTEKKKGETPHGGTRIKINKNTYKNDKIDDKIAA